MIKILYIITKSGIGGAQKYVSDLAGNLDKSKFKTKVLYGGKNIRWLSNKTWPWFLFFNDFLAILELINIYKIEQPNIVHLNSSKTGVLGSIAAFYYNLFSKNKIKVVFTAHGWVFNPTNALSYLERLFYIVIHKISSIFQDKIICVSQYDYKLTVAYNIAPTDKLVMIHNGINFNIQYLGKQEARKYIASQLANKAELLDNNWKWIGSIGRLTKEKDFQTFIQAASLIPEAYFFIIGEGGEFDDLIRRLADKKLQLENRFFIVPPTGGDYNYLKAFDVFVMSSVKEGLPYILLEAMAAEIPCVTTNAGGVTEIIKNGDDGLIVPQKNPELLSRAINEFLNDENLAFKLGKNAKETVTKKFNLKEMIIQTGKIYNDLIYPTHNFH